MFDKNESRCMFQATEKEVPFLLMISLSLKYSLISFRDLNDGYVRSEPQAYVRRETLFIR